MDIVEQATRSMDMGQLIVIKQIMEVLMPKRF